ncbi:Midasin [Trichinella spiralis]|uniref:Midasin n=1 Tax=Trichinella spiralis TaxID=6334 RepID=A0ABR3KH40_TRISP
MLLAAWVSIVAVAEWEERTHVLTHTHTHTRHIDTANGLERTCAWHDEAQGRGGAVGAPAPKWRKTSQQADAAGREEKTDELSTCTTG